MSLFDTDETAARGGLGPPPSLLSSDALAAAADGATCDLRRTMLLCSRNDFGLNADALQIAFLFSELMVTATRQATRRRRRQGLGEDAAILAHKMKIIRTMARPRRT